MALKPTAAAGLSQASFDRLLARLHADREQAGVQYEALRRKLVKFFEYRDCAAAEQAADQTIDRVARRLEGGEEIRAENAASYFLGVARNVLREHWVRPEGRWRDLETTDPGELAAAAAAQQPVAPDDDEERRWHCLERCLGQITAAERELVLEYYEWGQKQRIGRRKELCDRLGISLNALRIRAHRVRGALERCVALCAAGSGAK
jgi:DNA-directed RNA polymerase specialized sigma24 family protein